MPKGSAARAAAFRQAAGEQHVIAGRLKRISERTLRTWCDGADAGGVAALMPAGRADKGKPRVQVTRTWSSRCGLPADVQAGIEKQLEGFVRSCLAQGMSGRRAAFVSEAELQRLTRAAGVDLPTAKLKPMCKISAHWIRHFGEMKVVAAFNRDHRSFIEKHDHHVRRGLAARPMDLLIGDVWSVDVTVADAAARDRSGMVPISLSLIVWMDGSSGYVWAYPVICGPGQGVTQRDVVKSLWEVLTSPHGGMPENFMIDNGSEFAFLHDCITRFAALAKMTGPKVIRCRAYSPEGKGRLEGCFNIIGKGFVSALPGYNGGNPLRARMAKRGVPVASYKRGPNQLVADLATAVTQYNGTPQHGDLKGQSPKGTLEAKIADTGHRAQVPDEAAFDLIFSREERRDVRKGAVTIGGRVYSAPVLADMMGERQVAFCVPLRDPDAPVVLLRDGTLHQLHADTFGSTEIAGAHRTADMRGRQRDELARRAATATPGVDIQAALSAAADMTPVAANLPDAWTLAVSDRAGVSGAVITAAEAEAAEMARVRAEAEEYLAVLGEGRRGASGGNRNGPSCAT